MESKFENGRRIIFPTLSVENIRWAAPLILLYLTGGVLQLFGLLSPTQSALAVLVLFAPVLFVKTFWRQVKHETFIYALIAYITFWHFIFGAQIENTLTYYYYIFVTFFSAVTGRTYASKFVDSSNQETFIKLCIFFLLLQSLTMTFQMLFSDALVGFSKYPINRVDVIFGTLFLQSDAALSAICELMIIIVFSLNFKMRTRVLLAIMAITVIFLSNSKTAQFSVIVILALLLIKVSPFFSRSSELSKIFFGAAALLSLGVIIFINADFLIHFLDSAERSYYGRGEWRSAGRFAPLGQIYANGFEWWGQGPLTYYNPMTKTWLYNSGFSTLYSLQIDYGIIGFALYALYQFYLVLKFVRDGTCRLAFLFVFISYAMFNFALADVGFVFFYNFALMLVSKLGLQAAPPFAGRRFVLQRRYPNHQYENNN